MMSVRPIRVVLRVAVSILVPKMHVVADPVHPINSARLSIARLYASA